MSVTLLSRASAHGSQLKRQNLRVGGYTENSLKWFNYPHARAAMRLNGLASSVRPTRSLVAKFSAAFSRRLQYANFVLRGRTLQTRPRTGVCEPLKPDVVSLSGLS